MTNELGSRLKEMRQQLSWSTTDVSQFLGVPVALVERWELGAVPVPPGVFRRLQFISSFTLEDLTPDVARRVLRESHPMYAGEDLGTELPAWVAIPLGLTVLLVIVAGLFQVVTWSVAGIQWIATHATGWPLVYIGLPAVIALGVFLFLFRYKLRFFYGLSEIAFATYLSWHQLPEFPLKQVPDGYNAQNLVLAVMAGSVYLVVRGLDNMQQGWSTDVLIARIQKWRGSRSVVEAVSNLAPTDAVH